MSCSDDMTVRIWGMKRSNPSSESDRVAISGEMTVLQGHRNWVTGVSWSPVKLANGHELVATYVFHRSTPIATNYVQCIIRYHSAALGC
jgi:WD40 repeat protein